MARNTFEISKLVQMVNHRNANSTCSPAERQGWNSLLEKVLFEADAYDGFGYLWRDDLGEEARKVGQVGIAILREVNPGQRSLALDEEVTAQEFYDALLAENEVRREKGEHALTTPTGYYRVFPDETRRRYFYRYGKTPNR